MSSNLQLADLTDQGAALFDQLGSFWTNYYSGSAFIQDYLRAHKETELQTLQDLYELVDSVSRVECPIFHRERWLPLHLVASEQLEDERLTYGSAESLGTSAATTLSNRTFDWELPTDVVDIPFIVNVITDSEIVWTKNVDFFLDTDRNAIRFLTNPFVDSRFRPEPVYDDTNVAVDQELTVWAGQADLDKGYLAEQFGYIIRLAMDSSEPYQDLLNALWDADLKGTAREQLDQILQAICDAPITKTDGEVVQVVATELDRQTIVTDQNVYFAGSDATVLVVAGDELLAGDPLTDAFEVIELSQGTPDASVLSSLTLPTTYLMGAYTGGLTFNNEEVPLVVTTVSTRTKVTFDIDGAGPDVTLFWNTVHANGIADGAETLAQLLDTRPEELQTNDPDANSLPTYINPLDFLISNILRYGTTVVNINSAAFGSKALGADLLDRVLRTLTPPQGAVLVVQQ